MNRLLGVLGILAVGALVLAVARPASELSLLMMLNGEPGTVFVTEAGRDGGTLGISNIPTSTGGAVGSVIKTQCTAAACICPGAACVCPGASLASNFSSTVGEKLAADAVHFMVLVPGSTQVSVAPVSGSLRVDGGSGADCFHWPMK